jgi:hypothetical protein
MGRLLTLLSFFLAFTTAVLAQTSDVPAPQSPVTTPQPSTGASPSSAKKVWTNEDLAGSKGGVSVVGDQRRQSYHMGSTPSADAAGAERIKKSLEKLQTQLDDVSKQLKSYKEFQDGESVSKGERDLSKGYSRTPVDQRMAQLLDKKKHLEGQISDLLDEARKKGVDPGQLR